MTSIDQLILREANPFDSTTLRLGNFWQEEHNPQFNVDSIHQAIVTEVERILEQVNEDHRTRTLLLFGDSGVGKSYLLARIKQLLNAKAFFAYIGPWPDSNYIWRHILRHTVDSLMYVPQGQQESQLLLWLKSISVFGDRSLMKRLMGERQLFVRSLRSHYPIGIYNSKEFFNALYNLINPELYAICCDWLRGDDLDEEDLAAIGVKHAIDSEEAAQKIIANFGRIAASTQPIVLCFDNLDNIPCLADGFLDLQALFSINSTIHNEYLKNFLVIISLVTNTWKEHANRVQPADRSRIDLGFSLKPISLKQAEGLWESRLNLLHKKATPQPDSPIYPLTKAELETHNPRGKTTPRSALQLGSQLLQNYQAQLADLDIDTSGNNPLAEFQLVWHKELRNTQKQIKKISQLSSPELIKMLQEALRALKVAEIKPKLLPSKKYSNYSLSY